MVRTGMNKSGQSIREHVRTGLDGPEQTKTGHDMLGRVKKGTVPVRMGQDRKVLTPQNILNKPNFLNFV